MIYLRYFFAALGGVVLAALTWSFFAHSYVNAGWLAMAWITGGCAGYAVWRANLQKTGHGRQSLVRGLLALGLGAAVVALVDFSYGWQSSPSPAYTGTFRVGRTKLSDNAALLHLVLDVHGYLGRMGYQPAPAPAGETPAALGLRAGEPRPQFLHYQETNQKEPLTLCVVIRPDEPGIEVFYESQSATLAGAQAQEGRGRQFGRSFDSEFFHLVGASAAAAKVAAN